MKEHKLILGTVQFGLPYGVNRLGMLAYEAVVPILEKAHSAGIRTLDTAALYGTAHDVIGEFHASHPNTHFKIITKFPKEELSNINDTINGYCNTLGVHCLEGILFHSYDSYDLYFSKYKKSLLALKDEGVIKHLGVSVYTNKELERVIEDESIEIIQLPFNVLDNMKQRGALIKNAKASGKIVHTRSAFLQGLFFMDINSGHKIATKLKSYLESLQAIAQDEKTDIGSLAISYCISQLAIDNVLIGVDSIKQLEANIKNASKNLSSKAKEAIDEISVNDIDLLNPSLWNQIVSS